MQSTDEYKPVHSLRSKGVAPEQGHKMFRDRNVREEQARVMVQERAREVLCVSGTHQE